MSFIENINAIAKKLDIIVESNAIFDDGVIPILKEIAELDLQEAVEDLKKGNYLGNRKIDINLALNMIGITQDLIDREPDTAESIWTDGTKTVLYNGATVLFVDGHSIDVNFEFDGNPINISTHGDLLIQLSANAPFLDYLEDTLMAGFSADVVGEFVRFYDAIGQNSNLERITLHAVSGGYIEENSTYYWAKTTSAFETLSMRAGDIIKLGNEIDNLIQLSDNIDQVLQLQARIPELIDTYTDDVANGDETLYNRLSELVTLHGEITSIVAIYDDIKVGGTNYINTAGADLLLGSDSEIKKVNANKNNIDAVANNETNINAVNANKNNIDATADNETNINAVNANKNNIDAVANNETNINAVNANKDNIDTTATNIEKVSSVSENIPTLDEIVTNLVAIQNASQNAQTATTKAEEASQSATAALSYVEQMSGLTVEVVQLSSGSLPSRSYNSATNTLTLGIPQGFKGDRGEAFDVDASGTLAERDAYNGASKAFAYLTLDEEPTKVYFKASDASGDWSVGVPFGKGDKGDTGDTGRGILGSPVKTDTDVNVDTYTITYTDGTTSTFTVTNAKSIESYEFVSTTDASGLAGESGATDTYKITFNDATFVEIPVYNGLDSSVLSVNGKSGDVVLNKEDVGLSSVDDISDIDKPVSAATQDAINVANQTAVAMAIVLG